ncbi:hypothetical protein GGQ60_004440 [Pedobacter zeae]|uniref:Uncharacterized protein n=1 Tax=Pedobacter zeae TaxID=1737356 RepID=A0A7W6KEZ7_9SPHI|nr:hypothetical protein [Pedobacter zeae]
MRLFYIIFFLSITINFAGTASQGKRNDVQSKNTQISFLTGKKSIRQNSGFNQDKESLQKDFINSPGVKISSSSFVLITFLLFLFFKNKTIDKVVIKRLKHNYWCSFKMLYPKHFFW